MMFKRNHKIILRWEVFGVFFIVGIGSLLHFVFEWSGNNPIVGIFSAVNESVWEHLKLGFWSSILFALIEFPFVKRRINNFIVAKAAGILLLQSFILIFHYSYTNILGKEIPVLDIGSYVVGAILSQVISYSILKRKELKKIATILSLIFIILHGLALAVFTFYPPRLPIFEDNNTGTYGIQWSEKDK